MWIRTSEGTIINAAHIKTMWIQNGNFLSRIEAHLPDDECHTIIELPKDEIKNKFNDLWDYLVAAPSIEAARSVGAPIRRMFKPGGLDWAAPSDSKEE